MYVIFPADEVVYLSYGRLIYVPSVPRTAAPQPSQDTPAPQPQPSSGHSTGSCPSPSIPSTSSSRSFRSTASAPFSNLKPEKARGEVKKSSSNKELATAKQKDTLKVPKLKAPPPARDKRLSYSDFRPVHRCLKPEQQGKRSKTPQVDFDGLFSRREPSHSPEPQRRATPEKSPTRRKQFFGSAQKPEARVKRTADFGFGMASSESPFRDLTHPHYNELIKGHNGVTFKLIRTVSDFTQQLSQMYEQHAAELQHLVANFRKRNGELRKERPACASSLFHTWETLLQEVEIDSQALGDIASILGRQVSRPLLEKSFFRKIQSRKVFTHRESYETIIAKTEEKLVKCRQEYKNAYLLYLTSPSTDTLSAYFDSHNAYVQQLHATNGMLDEYGKETLPQLLQELEEIYKDLCSTLTEAVLQGAEVVSARAMEQCRRYEGLVSQCRNVNGTSDLSHLARSWPAPQGRAPIMKRLFVPPQPPPPPETEEDGPSMPMNENIPPPLKDELVIDRLSAVQVKPSHDALRKQAIELDAQIRQIQDALDTTVRLQQRSLEASLFNKANEIQEDISMKRFDLRVAQIHLSAINSQKELFSNKLDNSGDSGRERKLSNASQGSMKTKWLKAFKSLKTPPPETEKKNQMYHAVSTIIQMRKNGSAATRELLKGDPDAHNFQEYTYKKITPCDICSQVLRGHTRQGLKCRICKMNVHVDCQEKASKCQAKARLLRRQKSTSEIETRIPDSTVEDEKSPEVDLIYQVLKQAGEISNSKGRIETPTVGITVDRGATPSGSGQSLNRRPLAGPAQPPPRPQGSNLCVVNPAPCSTSSAPHSPRRQKLNLRMKSLSLDSPESTEHVQRRKHHGAAATSDPHSNQSSSSRIQSPSSPVHNRRLLSAKNIRMSSVELPDDNEKSPSSASTSPCPSPVGGKKPHRLLPTNLYVVLYNFKSRHQDELDLKAGYKVTVIDTSDPDWWKGKCLGRVGYFPSKYCSKLSPGEKPLQVTHNLQVSDGDNGLMLLRDQIVIQIGEELDGMVMIRSGDNRQGVCPVKFLQEV